MTRIVPLMLGLALVGLPGMAVEAQGLETPQPTVKASARGLQSLWEYDFADYRYQRIYVTAGTPATEAKAVPDLARLGRADFWTAGSAGCAPESATDGNTESFSAVPSTAPHAGDLPKDLGVAWPTPQTISQVRLTYHSRPYTPAVDGQDLQVWLNDEWVSVGDQLSGTEGAEWVHTFEPLTTTRVRLLITRLRQHRPAIRSFEVFAAPVEARHITTRANSWVADPVLVSAGPQRPPLLAVQVPGRLEMLSATGRLLWETDGIAPGVVAGDLDGEGGEELVVASATALRCYDREGNLRWETGFPRDHYSPQGQREMTPLTPARCVDLNGDGRSELLAHCEDNGALYAYDSAGQPLWRTEATGAGAEFVVPIRLPGLTGTAVVTSSGGDTGQVLGSDGQSRGQLNLGAGDRTYALAIGDLEGDGRPEILSGGATGVHCQTWGAETVWDLPTPEPVATLTLADLRGDGQLEVVITDRSRQVTVADAQGQTLWQSRPQTGGFLCAVGNLQGDPRPEVVLAGGLDILIFDGMGQPLPGLPVELGEVMAGRWPFAWLRGLSLVDLNGDGKAEVLALSQTGRLYALRSSR